MAYTKIRVLLSEYQFPDIFYIRYTLACAKFGLSKRYNIPAIVKQSLDLVQRQVNGERIPGEEIEDCLDLLTGYISSTKLSHRAKCLHYAVGDAVTSAMNFAYKAEGRKYSIPTAICMAHAVNAANNVMSAYSGTKRVNARNHMVQLLADMIRSEFTDIELLLMDRGDT